MHTVTPKTHRLPDNKPKSWLEALEPADVAKQLAFYESTAKHRNMEQLFEDLMPLLMPYSESNIIIITGATGVGKTTMSKVLLKSLFADFARIRDADSSALPLIAVEAYANGERTHSFKPLYEDMRDQLLEPGTEHKSSIKVVDGKMVVSPQSKMTIANLRKVVESGLKHRKTQVCVIDEAYHLLRFGKDSAVMDTLKSLANTTGVKLVLVGSFDLFDLVVEHGQVARRTAILNFERYRIEVADDRAEFKSIIMKLQSKWTCDEVPNFAAIADELLETSLGCVGLLKSLLLDASAMQLRNGGKWNSEFLKKAAKANTLRKLIAKEIEVGESKVRDALVGDCLWDAKVFADMEARMETSRV